MTTDAPPAPPIHRLTPRRAVGLAVAYGAVGAGVLLFFQLGRRPWTGFMVFMVVTWAFQIHVSRRPWWELGLRFQSRSLVEWAGGLAGGAGLFALVAGALAATGAARFTLTREGVHPGEALGLLVALALLEELFFRGYPLVTLARAFGPMRAGLALSGLFAALHLFNPGMGGMPLLGVALAGVVMTLLFLKWRTLWLPWGFHFGWNAAQGLLFGFPTSGIAMKELGAAPLLVAHVKGPAWWTGGAFGPEASLPALLALAGCAALLLTPRVGPSPGEAQAEVEAAIAREMGPPDEWNPLPPDEGSEPVSGGPSTGGDDGRGA